MNVKKSLKIFTGILRSTTSRLMTIRTYDQNNLAVFLLNFQLFIKLVTIMRFKSNMRRFVR